MSNIKKQPHKISPSTQWTNMNKWAGTQVSTLANTWNLSKRMSNTHVMLFPTDYQSHHSPPTARRPTAVDSLYWSNRFTYTSSQPTHMKHLQQHTNDLYRPLVYIQDHTSSHTHTHSYTKKDDPDTWHDARPPADRCYVVIANCAFSRNCASTSKASVRISSAIENKTPTVVRTDRSRRWSDKKTFSCKRRRTTRRPGLNSSRTNKGQNCRRSADQTSQGTKSN